MLRKKIAKLALYGIATFTIATGCNRIVSNSKEEGKDKAGNEYKIFRSGENQHFVSEGDIVDFHLVVKNHKDSVLQDTYKQQMPITNFEYNEKKMPIAKAILTMFKRLTDGDSAVFRIKTEVEMTEAQEMARKQMERVREERKLLPDSIAKKTEERFQAQMKQMETEIASIPKYYPAGKFITYHVKVLKLTNPKNMEKKEKEEISSYIKKNNLTVKTTPSGLQYAIIKEGKGAPAKKGDAVKVHYVGKLSNGKVFDTSLANEAAAAKLNRPPGHKFEPFTLQVGMGQVIPGWDEGLLLLNKGTKAVLLIPNKLAYGMQSPSPDIPAGAPLFFDIEVMDILPGNAR